MSTNTDSEVFPQQVPPILTLIAASKLFLEEAT